MSNEYLTTDSKHLVSMYPCNKQELIQYKDALLPALLLCQRKINSVPFSFTINKSSSTYTLPTLVEQQTNAILETYKNSVIYNNINIRLDDFSANNNSIDLKYSLTTYFNSLLTNRIMDCPLAGTLTIRDLYEPGPLLHELSDSVLSNHLGFNGFVELADERIIFVKRNSKLSIGQNMWSQSIGASLKTMYAVENGALTVNGISNAIRKEIYDELRIAIDDSVDLSDSIFAFYRDLVEGGKPQFLFYYKCNFMDTKSFVENFKYEMNKIRKENERLQIVDGEIFEFYSLNDLKTSDIYDDRIVVDNKTMHMMPSSLTSIALLLNNIN